MIAFCQSVFNKEYVRPQ